MIAKPRVYATIEARMTSTRLPGKVLLDAAGVPMLQRMIERLRRVPALDGIVVATTTNASDDPIEELTRTLGVGCFRGSEDDVMERVLGAARAHDIDVIVETTGDCPLIDPAVVQTIIDDYFSTSVDYAANVLERTYPIGMDTQVFATEVLAEAFSLTDAPDDREHVSLFIYRHPELYTLNNRAAPEHQHDPQLRLTLDTAEDLAVIRAVFEALLPVKPDFGLDDILAWLRDHPEIRAINSTVQHRWV